MERAGGRRRNHYMTQEGRSHRLERLKFDSHRLRTECASGLGGSCGAPKAHNVSISKSSLQIPQGDFAQLLLPFVHGIGPFARVSGRSRSDSRGFCALQTGRNVREISDLGSFQLPSMGQHVCVSDRSRFDYRGLCALQTDVDSRIF